MGLMMIVGLAWLFLATTAVAVMSFVGRAASNSDRSTSAHLSELLQDHGPVRLAVSNEAAVEPTGQAVCPSCASFVTGAVEGDDCPTCGTRVTELPRIRRHVPEDVSPIRHHRAV